jgi:hypothetical protein
MWESKGEQRRTKTNHPRNKSTKKGCDSQFVHAHAIRLPLWGGVGVGVVRFCAGVDDFSCVFAESHLPTPLPALPHKAHKGGGSSQRGRSSTAKSAIRSARR